MQNTPVTRTALLLLAGLAAYGAVLLALVGAVPGGSDTSGYFNEARLFARGRIHADARFLPGLPPGEAPPYLYVPLGFRPATDGPARLVPTYPPGLPLLLIPAARLVGWRHAGDLVLVLHSLAGIALTYALGRRCGLPAPWSLLGAAVLAASPLYLYTSLWALSDVPATAWATAAVLAAWKSRERPAWALAAGACLAVAFLVRPNNFLILVPMALAIGPSPLRLLAVGITALPGIAAWMEINRNAYGAYLQSGYGAIGAEFHSSLVAGTLAYCARWLPLLASPIVIAAPAIVLFLRHRTRPAAILASWFLVYLAFFLPYRWTHENWWFLRYLLPAAPALIVAALVVIEAGYARVAARRPGNAVRALMAAALLAAVAVEIGEIGPLEAWTIGRGERKYGRVADWLRGHVPPNAAVVASQFSGSLFYYTGLTLLRTDQLDPATAPRAFSAARSAGRPLYAVLFPFEQAQLKAIPGPWSQVGAIDDVTVWRLGPPPR
jgi:hypothetical protein